MTNGLNSELSAKATRRIFLSTAASSVAVAPLVAAAKQKPEIETTPGGVKFIFIKQGSGPNPRKGDICLVDYTGYLPDNTVFDSSDAPGRKPLAFKLGARQVIPGWEEVLPYMSVGAEVQAVVPAKLAYGSKGVCLDSGECLIKPDTDLKFDIKLKRVAIPPP
eukprot:CAMPEP_0194714448 /NCGR_PEP_ID=MMETSP0296-20130528/6038_1 /TAXON_ID=39354 /ORGANISM="Heterosigma akashiwo, Strain CCMP2393" /LENGTH=162 /DNA_ID=CAMNT_0039613561 /DNA_START=167 /DNA_END=655 /DNA_ORIENTATION=-